MKQYKQLLNELPSKTVVFAFGRFNPPTTGHELLMRVVQRLATQKRADHVVFASKTQNAKKDPLSVDKKIKYLKMMFPQVNFRAADQEVRTFIEAAAKLSKMGYKNAIMVAGSDRVAEFKRLLNTYNGKDFKFETVDVVSAGQRDPDADNAQGMSATKMRDLAKKGDFNGFKKGLPTTMREIDARRLMNDIRMGLGMTAVREEINLVNDNLREEYFRGDIFNVGDIIESNQELFQIIKRGSNHLLVRNSEGELVSKWIHDCKETQMNEAQEKGKLTNKTVRKTDRIKVARMIAMMLGVDNPEQGSPENLVNLGLRKIRVKALNPESIRLVSKIIELAKEYEIKYDPNLVPTKLKEGTTQPNGTDEVGGSVAPRTTISPRVAPVNKKRKDNIAGDILSPEDFRKLSKMNNEDRDDGVKNTESDFDAEYSGFPHEVGKNLVAGNDDHLRRRKVAYKLGEATSNPQQAARSQKKIAKANLTAKHEAERMSLANKHARETDALNKEEVVVEKKRLKKGLKDACWAGYEAIGMKDKDGKKVPNCVPVKEDKKLAKPDSKVKAAGEKPHDEKWVKHEETDAEKNLRHKKDLNDLERDIRKSGSMDKQTQDAINKRRQQLHTEEADQEDDIRAYEKQIQITDFTDKEIDDIVAEVDWDDMLDEYGEDELIIVDSETDEEVEDDDEKDVNEEALMEVLSRAERMKMRFKIRKTKAKRNRALKIALRRRSTSKVVNKRARRLAIKALKKRFLHGRTASSLSVGEKERLERIVAKRKNLINRIAIKLVPKVRQMEKQRVANSSKKKK